MRLVASSLRIGIVTALALSVVSTGAFSAAIVDPLSPSMTRAEVVTALLVARDAPVAPLTMEPPFPDVSSRSWYAPYMVVAEQYGIISADPFTRELRPTAAVNRAEFLKMLVFTFGLEAGLAHSFTDVPRESWFHSYAGIAEKYALFPESDLGTLDPLTHVTSEDVRRAVLLIRQDSVSESTKREQMIALAQSRKSLRIYSIISTRGQQVLFTDARSNTPQLPAPKSGPALEQLREEVFALVNALRAQEGIPPLRNNTNLEASAQLYAQEMATEGFFGHVSPTGKTLKERIEATGYYDRGYSIDCRCIKGYTLGENLAYGQQTAEEVMEAWMNSPSHREAILSPHYSDTGVGVSAGVWVQHFGGVLLP